MVVFLLEFYFETVRAISVLLLNRLNKQTLQTYDNPHAGSQFVAPA